VVSKATAANGKDYSTKFDIQGRVLYARLEGRGSVDVPGLQFGNTVETSEYSLTIEEGGYGLYGMDEDTVAEHVQQQQTTLQRIRDVGVEMAIALWANKDVLAKSKADLISDFIEDNEEVKKLAKSKQPKVSTPAALEDFPGLKKKWLRKLFQHFPVSGEVPVTVKAKAKAFRSVYKNNKKTDELLFTPIPVNDVMGTPLNGGVSEMIKDAEGNALCSKKQAIRHVQRGDLVQATVCMKMWVVNQNCGIKLHLVRVKKLVEGPGESNGFGDDIDTSHYASLGNKRPRAQDSNIGYEPESKMPKVE
jgi:hypothetical protein